MACDLMQQNNSFAYRGFAVKPFGYSAYKIHTYTHAAVLACLVPCPIIGNASKFLSEYDHFKFHSLLPKAKQLGVSVAQWLEC